MMSESQSAAAARDDAKTAGPGKAADAMARRNSSSTLLVDVVGRRRVDDGLDAQFDVVRGHTRLTQLPVPFQIVREPFDNLNRLPARVEEEQ